MKAGTGDPIVARILDQLDAILRGVARIEQRQTDQAKDIDALDRRLAPYGDGSRDQTRQSRRRG